MGDHSVKICVLGPANPGQLRDFMFDSDNARAIAHDIPSGQSVVSLARGLLEKGHYVSVVSISDGPEDIRFSGEKFSFTGLAISRRARWQVLTLWERESRKLRDVVNTVDCDVVHAQWTYEYAMAGLRSKKPLVITAHDAPWTIFLHFKDAYRFFRLVYAHVVALVARRRGIVISAVSPYLKSAWEREMAWSRDMPVVPNAVSAPTGKHEKAAYPLVVEVADNSQRKNIKNLLRAMEVVRHRFPEAQLVLLGHGLGDDGPLAGWARLENLDEGVAFLGHQKRDKIEEMLGSALVHAHVSREESFGLTMVEAMAAGTAVLAGKKSGAVPWILEHGEAGILANVEDPNEIADGICQLLADPKLRERLSQRGRTRFETYFSVGATVDGYLALYERVLQAPPRGS